MDNTKGVLKEGFGYYKTVEGVDIIDESMGNHVMSYPADSILLLDNETALKYAKSLIKLDENQQEIDPLPNKKSSKGTSLEDVTVNK